MRGKIPSSRVAARNGPAQSNLLARRGRQSLTARYVLPTHRTRVMNDVLEILPFRRRFRPCLVVERRC